MIATGGAWLAHERWPGKLELLTGPDLDTEVDTLPIVAAVRKSDGD